MYLYVYTNDPHIKSENYDVMWQVTPEYKIQLVSCDLSPKYILRIYVLKYIHSIDAYILCGLLWYLLLSNVLSVFFDLYAQVLGFSVFQLIFLSEVSGFGKFARKLFSNPHLKHVFGFQPLCSLQLLLELHELKGGFL